MPGKLSKIHFNISLSPYFKHFRTLYPGLKKNNTLKCISHSFPGILTYLLFFENFWKSTRMYSFSPIQFKLVLKFPVTRISQCDLRIFINISKVHFYLKFLGICWHEDNFQCQQPFMVVNSGWPQHNVGTIRCLVLSTYHSNQKCVFFTKFRNAHRKEFCLG